MNIKEVLKKWAQSEEFQQRLAEANKMILQALKRHKKMYVAYSGGKDSTALLHLVLHHDPNILVFHWDYGPYLMPRAYEKEIIENMRKIGAKNIYIDTSDKYKSREDTGIWYKEFFGRVVPELLKQGYDGCFVGIRKEESISRKLRIEAQKSLTKIKEIWPLQDWSWKDVWAYIFAFDVPYHSVYDKYAPIVGWDKARFVTFFDKEFDTLGASNVDGILSWRWRYDSNS
jgi:3'-phosphoadenosine 5'-phosphosulfate sulfotransferase (PAPS reductase)/FAD synthetase